MENGKLEGGFINWDMQECCVVSYDWDVMPRTVTILWVGIVNRGHTGILILRWRSVIHIKGTFPSLSFPTIGGLKVVCIMCYALEGREV